MNEINPEIAQEAIEVYDVLVDTYGERPAKIHRKPVDELVLTILSQNTSDVNSRRAFQHLVEAFPTWDQVVHAPTEAVAEAIRMGGLANMKAPRIQNALEYIYEQRGEYALDFMADMSVKEARKWLVKLKGIGPKTASCVLLFALGMPAFPVDTHVHRVSRRLGLIPEKANPEQTSELFEEMVDPELYYPFHILLIQHGRVTCKAQRPQCDACPLTTYCDYYAANPV